MPEKKPALAREDLEDNKFELENREFKFKEPGEDPEYDAWFREQVQIGLDQINRGEVIPHETVERRWEAMRAELLQRIKEGK